MHVLIIEDHQDSAEALGLLLESEGYSVQIANDGESGITLAELRPPDVALIDIELPGIDGYEVGRRLRAHQATRHTVLVAVTGHSDRKSALERGFDECIRKPPSNFILALLYSIEQRAATHR